jgi:hypothetical protein
LLFGESFSKTKAFAGVLPLKTGVFLNKGHKVINKA